MTSGSPGPVRHRASARWRAGAAGLAGACALLAGGAPPAAAGGLITVIDNSHADSWVEVDRTANVQQGGGSAGSDHDGAGAVVGGALKGGSVVGGALGGGAVVDGVGALVGPGTKEGDG
ncbi:hypothetical protein ACFVSN_08555 [Kitasatospora sp. NPDC057904]|uniref:hypothetical protein n=1 Tax=Kitasatospora sp. NPDC057904 TaxID=3346275 RepID=UPI0036DF363C